MFNQILLIWGKAKFKICNSWQVFTLEAALKSGDLASLMRGSRDRSPPGQKAMAVHTILGSCTQKYEINSGHFVDADIFSRIHLCFCEDIEKKLFSFQSCHV